MECTRAGKYLTFHLGAEEYAVQVRHVREIIGLQEITAVPQTPPQVKGVINLRGKVIPVVDLRVHCNRPQNEYLERTCIVVVQIARSQGELLTGVIVDSVSEVVNFSSAEIENTPELANGAAADYLLGLAKSKGKVKVLLDIDRLLSSTDVASLMCMTTH